MRGFTIFGTKTYAKLRWNSLFQGQTIEQKFPIVLPQNSFTPVTNDEKQKLWENTKTVDTSSHTFTQGFPVSQATIDQSPNLRMNSYFEPGLFAGVDTTTLQQKGIKNVTQFSGLPKDAAVHYDYDFTKFDASMIAIGIAGVKQGEGTNSFTPAYTNYLMILKDKQNGDQFSQTFSVLYGKPLIEPALYPKETRPVYENGTPIKSEDAIEELTTDLQDWDGKNQALPGQKGQIVYGNITPLNGGLDSSGNIIIFNSVFLKTPVGNTATQQ